MGDEPNRHTKEAVQRKLVRLRIELFTAAQTLKGELLKEFWELVNDIHLISPEQMPPNIGHFYDDVGNMLRAQKRYFEARKNNRPEAICRPLLVTAKEWERKVKRHIDKRRVPAFDFNN